MSLEKLKSDLKKLSESKFKIVAQAEKENRKMTAKEESMVAELDGAISGIEDEIKHAPAHPPFTLCGSSILGNDSNSTRRDGDNTIIPPGGKKRSRYVLVGGHEPRVQFKGGRQAIDGFFRVPQLQPGQA